MSESLERALLSMGYREMAVEVFAKPVGYHLLVCKIADKKIYNYFRGLSAILLWDSQVLDEDYLVSLKYYESGTRFDVGQAHIGSSFEFLTAEQSFSAILLS